MAMYKGKGQLPFVPQHTYRLIAIAEDRERLLTHELVMPSDSYTLYQLKRQSVSRRKLQASAAHALKSF